MPQRLIGCNRQVWVEKQKGWEEQAPEDRAWPKESLGLQGLEDLAGGKGSLSVRRNQLGQSLSSRLQLSAEL